MDTELSDFELSHENCEKEPIHRPVEIQSHGCMLVFKDKEPERLFAMSANVSDLLGKTDSELWEKDAAKWMPKNLHDCFVSNTNNGKSTRGTYTTIELGGKQYNVIVHHYIDSWFVELELKVSSAFDYLQEILKVSNAIKSCETLDDLYKTTATQLKKIIGYDRVMIYQFDEDGHGQVIGEEKESHLESFFGIHYPATDIPQIARELFVKNKVRIITNTYESNHKLAFRRKENEPIPHLDLTYTQLRATSPVHIEYLKNMGVNATLSIALVHENNLWGLFACHHYSERLISYEFRRALEIISDVFTYTRYTLQQKEQQEVAKVFKNYETTFLNQLDLNENISAQLTHNQQILLDLCDAQGAASVAQEKSTFSVGLAPSKQELVELRNWMIVNGHHEMFSTSNFKQDVPIGVDFSAKIGGMLCICTSLIEKSYLFWFREPVRRQTTWGGNPNAPYEMVSSEGSDEIRLSPRKSFEKWESIIEDQAVPWKEFELEMAERIREAILKKEFQRAAEKVDNLKEEFMELTYIASHDLLQPLRTVTNYMDLFYDEIKEVENENISYYITRTRLAISRMDDLVQDLLSYSRLGKNNAKVDVPINEVLKEIKEDLNELISTSNAKIIAGDFPVLKGDRLEIKQLFQNLIGNALKYVRPGVPPVVELSAERDGKYWFFKIKDNGIGIEDDHFDKIFEMFQRLHTKEEYAGTGIGLALVKKIVQSYEGKIDVQSTVNEGTTFSIKIHEMNTAH